MKNTLETPDIDTWLINGGHTHSNLYSVRYPNGMDHNGYLMAEAGKGIRGSLKAMEWLVKFLGEYPLITSS